jgi:hypothetical protein
MKNYPLVLIEWMDAQSMCEWGDIVEIQDWIKTDCIVREVGWIVEENNLYVVITSQVQDTDFGNRTKIPKKWITKRTKLCQSSRLKLTTSK